MATGKGGVGKSLLSCLLANTLSQKGTTILYYDSKNPSPIYKFVSKNVILYPLDYEKEAKEYVKLKLRFFILSWALTRSDVFRVFSRVIPGFRELIFLGRMWYDHYLGRYQFYVFDAPPVGQIIPLLKIPFSALDSGVGGFAKSDLEKMAEFVKKLKIILVCIPEYLSYEETAEAIQKMKQEGLEISALVLNKFYEKNLSREDELWIDRILTEGKLSAKEKEELINLYNFDTFFSLNSSKFLKLYKSIFPGVIKIPFSIEGIDADFIGKQMNIIQASVLSHLF